MENKIKKLQSQVIKPLTIENKVKDEIIKRVKSEYDANLKLLRMLNTILRLPTMTTEFQRAMRAQNDEK